MKKAIILILALTLILSLVCACSGSPEATSTEPAISTEAPASAETSGFEEMHLTVASPVNPQGAQAKTFNSLMDHVTEATGGAVTFTAHWNSTLCDPGEELYLMEESAIDLCNVQEKAYGDILPLYQIPFTYVGTPEEAKEYFYDVYFNNEETAAIEAASFAKYNGKMLGMAYIGKQGYYARFDWSSLEDLEGKKIGTTDPTVSNYLGLNTVVLAPPQTYESLQHGVIDGGTFGFDGYYNLHFYEVAPYWGFDGSVSWGSPYVVRKDLWESFSPELQQIFRDAAESAAALSVELVNESEISAIETIEASGGKTFLVPEADQYAILEANIVAVVEKGFERAETQGITDEMTTVLKYSVGLMGYDWRW